MPIDNKNPTENRMIIHTPEATSTEQIPVGSIVRVTKNDKTCISIITKECTRRDGTQGYETRMLNGKNTQLVERTQLHMISPDPSFVPNDPSDIDPNEMARYLTQSDVSELWKGNVDDTTHEAARVTLYWHHRLRHACLVTLHRLATRGLLPKCILKVMKMPLCAACAFATAHRRNRRYKGKHDRPIRKETNPGEGTSCDHIVSHQPGLMPQSTGILAHARFWGSVLYVDHATDFIYNHLVTGISSDATLESKHAYERVLAAYGRKVKGYHADNLRFNDAQFTSDCHRGQQKLTFCGVGAHHQNGLVECKIKEICYGARTVLLHAKRKWSDVITIVLWPYALQATVERHNRLSLDADGRSPLEKMSNTSEEIVPTDFHTFGCPVFVLDAANQSGGIGTSKWEPRSRAGIYLGHSPTHAGSVALILHLQTGHISPQFHLIFDDEFTTVPYINAEEAPPNWSALVEHNSEHTDYEQGTVSQEWLHMPDMGLLQGTQTPDNQLTVPEGAQQTVPLDDSNQITASEGAQQIIPADNATHITAPERANQIKCSEGDILHNNTDKSNCDITLNKSCGGRNNTQSFVNLDTLGLKRSSRMKKPSMLLKESDSSSKDISRMKKAYGLMVLALSTFAQNPSSSTQQAVNNISHCYQSRVIEYEDFLDKNFDGSNNKTSPLAQIYMTSRENNECYSLKEMLKQPDRNLFMEAMNKEVKSMFEEEIWKLVPKRDMIDYFKGERNKGKEIQRERIMTIWSFKRKRHPDGSLDKHKARLCCHEGQQQHGINYWDTYAPVVSWSSVRILMTIAKLHNLHTKSLDFVQAYPQAKIKTPIYLYNPAGVVLNNTKGDVVLMLVKNLYGLKDAGLTWFEHLSKGLDEMGFVPTNSDPCIFVNGTDIIILYVDDCVIISRTGQEASAIFNKLEEKGFKLTDEGTMEEYLGIVIDHNKDGSFRMSQPYLIDRIIAAIPSMKEARSAKTPAAAGDILIKDVDGDPRKEHWEYRSVIGMLNYLVNCTHPEMSYAVHQCARFCNNPRYSHEQAVKRIIRYLIGIKRDQTLGIVFKPDKTLSIETYVDASFAGEWNQTWSEEPSSVMSRTGYTIRYANCNIIWCSKLQTEIALSTTESEYIALSHSLRDTLPLMELLREIRNAIPSPENIPKIHCTVFEDNKGCIELAKAPRMRPRTKHIALKYHHFRRAVIKKQVSIQYVETGLQIADIFTKALNDAQFLVLRKMLNGW